MEAKPKLCQWQHTQPLGCSLLTIVGYCSLHFYRQLRPNSLCIFLFLFATLAFDLTLDDFLLNCNIYIYLVAGGGGCSCMLLLHLVPTSADAGPALCTLHRDSCTLHLWCFPSFQLVQLFHMHRWWLSSFATSAGGAFHLATSTDS